MLRDGSRGTNVDVISKMLHGRSSRSDVPPSMCSDILLRREGRSVPTHSPLSLIPSMALSSTQYAHRPKGHSGTQRERTKLTLTLVLADLLP